MLLSALLLLFGMVLQPNKSEKPIFRSELIAPPEALHNHGSCIVETPKGNLLVCWYRGSGERGADDVQVMGARRQRGSSNWSERFVLQDTPGFPDTNPCMIIEIGRAHV